MVISGVETTLRKHGHRCSNARDREYLTSWLGLLVLLRRLHLHIDHVRCVMNLLTWQKGKIMVQVGGVMITKYVGPWSSTGGNIRSSRSHAEKDAIVEYDQWA